MGNRSTVQCYSGSIYVFKQHIQVNELFQAQQFPESLLGKSAAVIFRVALVFAGISSTTTAAMFKEPYDIKDVCTRIGIGSVLFMVTAVIFMISDPFKGLKYSQMFLSI